MDSIRPSLTVWAGYAVPSGWPDAEQSDATETMALIQYGRGADGIVDAARDGGVLGAARAESANPDRHVWLMGVFTDEILSVAPGDRDRVLTSLVPRDNGVIFSMINNYLETGNASPSGPWSIADGAMSYSRSGRVLSGSFDRMIQAAIDDITSGRVVVPLAPVGELLDVPGTDGSVEVTVSYDGNGCFYEGPAFIPIGTMLDVEFVNHSGSPSVAAMGRSRPVEIAARPGALSHGQVAMVEDALPIRCEPLLAGNDAASDAALHPQWNVTDEEADVIVTLEDDGCRVDTTGELVEGQLVVFQARGDSAANGGTYSWAVAPGFDAQDFSPSFAAEEYWRWQDIAARSTRAYARGLTAGSWGVGCWRGVGGQREHFFGGLLEVAAPDA